MQNRIKAVIFDMDLTLVDTSALAQLRSDRNWGEVYKRIPLTTMYPGIPQLLAKCKELDVRIGIVTTSPSTYCSKVLLHHSLAIDTKVCYHDVPKGGLKPAPDQMLRCASLLGVLPAVCLTLGDDPRDIHASHNAGMKSAAALWGSPSPQELVAASPTFLCETPLQFQALLENLTS